MPDYTVFTNLKVTGDLNIAGTMAAPAATKTKAGAVKMAAKVNEAAGSNPTAAEFKALLDALKAAGIMSGS